MTGSQIIALGIEEGPEIGEAMRLADVMGREGKTDPQIKETLFRLFKRNKPELLQMRKVPEGFLSALPTPETPVEIVNRDKCEQNMSEMMSIPVVKAGALMPDACPAGGGITVGGVIEVEGAIIPSAHSADICCSMRTTFFDSHLAPNDIMDGLMLSTHFGNSGGFDDVTAWEMTDKNRFLKGMTGVANKQFGTQGDGNHFASLGRITVSDELVDRLTGYGYPGADVLRGRGTIYAITTHHGSRGLGGEVYKRGQRAAVKYTASVAKNIPAYAAWLSLQTVEGKEYWDALKVIQFWTKMNHLEIHGKLFLTTGSVPLFTLFNEHNFVWRKDAETPWEESIFVHGKGATPTSLEGRPQIGIIPLNMAEPILLVAGKETNGYLDFAPHGAGRNESRTALLKNYTHLGDDRGISVRDSTAVVAEQTKGLDIRWFNGRPDISESPVGYKSADKIRKAIKDFDLCEEIGHIEPVGCIMAGEFTPHWKKGKNGRSNGGREKETGGQKEGEGQSHDEILEDISERGDGEKTDRTK